MDPEFELSPERAHELLEEGGADFVDVREEHEWAAGRMPGSRWIPLDRLAGEADSLAGERPVVFVCRVGARSGMAAAAFRRAGVPAFNLSGGLAAWTTAGLPLDPPGGHVASH
jgi:rhodanese-related sulfurtransferase